MWEIKWCYRGSLVCAIKSQRNLHAANLLQSFLPLSQWMMGKQNDQQDDS